MKKTNFYRQAFALSVCFLLFFASCKNKPLEEQKTASIADSINYFPDRIQNVYSKNFRVQYFSNYKILTLLKPFQDSDDSLQIVLYQRNTPKPKGFSKVQFIEIPVEKTICLSSTQTAFVEFLGKESTLQAIQSKQYICSPKIEKLISEGKIKETGLDENLNVELILSLKAKLLLTSGLMSGGKFDKYAQIIQNGTAVIPISEWLEKHPLARAEWLKLIAIFFNEEKFANQKFEEIAQKYLDVAKNVEKIAQKPTVFCDMPFKDVWYMAGGKSYIAQLFADAGADYCQKNDTNTASLSLDFEKVYPIGLKTDVWLNLGMVKSKTDVLAQDKRFAKFKSFQKNQMYNYHKKNNAQGFSDYWYSAVVNPQVVLMDLVKILHPDLMPDYETVYYEALK